MFDFVKKWIHEHRKGIVITVSIIGIVGGVAILIINGKKVTMPLNDVAKRIIPETPATFAEETANITIPVDDVISTFSRSSFIRLLHEGWQASASKVAQASELGITLNPGETIVNECIVTMRAA